MPLVPATFRHLLSSLVLLTMVPLASAAAPTNRHFPVQARVADGLIEGLYDAQSGIQRYLGVPFAAPPVGDLRWKAPQPVQPWTGVRETKQFGPSPVQGVVFDDIVFRSSGMSEDCLYLNIWTPARRDTQGLPVLVYFYGGGFVVGDASEARYDGASLAAKGIVVVTTNYRLNIFGGFAHPELSAEAPYHASGNYGFLDQNAALRWVRDNIAAFGGNPAKITIAGESAGSMSVSAQMASPLSKDLLAGAIGQSGSMMGNAFSAVPLAAAEQTGAEFARQAGGLSLAQLRALSTREIFELYQESRRFGFPAVIDGHFLPKSPAEIYRAGEQARVPLLVGWNSAEIPGYAFVQAPLYSPDNYAKRVREAYPKDHDAVLRVYPGTTEAEVEEAATALASDRFIAYSAWRWFDLHRRTSGQPTFRYLYSHLPPVTPPQADPRTGAAAPSGPRPFGAPHACEIPYCLGNLPLQPQFPWTPADYKVSDLMQAQFAAFIKTGSPNTAGLPDWPAARPEDAQPQVMVIGESPRVELSKSEARYQVLLSLDPER